MDNPTLNLLFLRHLVQSNGLKPKTRGFSAASLRRKTTSMGRITTGMEPTLLHSKPRDMDTMSISKFSMRSIFNRQPSKRPPLPQMVPQDVPESLINRLIMEIERKCKFLNFE